MKSGGFEAYFIVKTLIGILTTLACFVAVAQPDGLLENPSVLDENTLSFLKESFEGPVSGWYTKDLTESLTWVGDGRFLLVEDCYSPKNALVQLRPCGESRIVGYNGDVPDWIEEAVSARFSWEQWRKDSGKCFKEIRMILVHPLSRVLDSRFFSQPSDWLQDYIHTQTGGQPLSVLKSYETEYSIERSDKMEYVEANYIGKTGQIIRVRIVHSVDGQVPLRVERTVEEAEKSFHSQALW